jgi:hypothetical protein
MFVTSPTNLRILSAKYLNNVTLKRLGTIAEEVQQARNLILSAPRSNTDQYIENLQAQVTSILLESDTLAQGLNLVSN